MRHNIKKIKFSQGCDSKKAVVRKLVYNFLMRGRLTTTQTKAKFIKPVIEKTIEKAKNESEANKNYLLKQFGNTDFIKKMFTEIGPNFKNITGGYVRLVKFVPRDSDGANMARIEWAHPLAAVEKPEVVKTTKDLKTKKA